MSNLSQAMNGLPDLKLYKVPEVAKILGKKKSFVYELIYTGRLKATKLSSRGTRISESALIDYLTKESGLQAEN